MSLKSDRSIWEIRKDLDVRGLVVRSYDRLPFLVWTLLLSKGLGLSLCNIVWPGVHSLAVPFLILLLFYVAWRLCESTTPIVPAFVQQFWATIASPDRFQTVKSLRNDNATSWFRSLGRKEATAGRVSRFCCEVSLSGL